MRSKIFKLALFELKNNILYSKNWISSLAFLILNMAISAFTINPNPQNLQHIFLSSSMTSMLLGIVLISSHIFDEDAADGSIDQYQLFGLPMFAIYLSKVIVVACEFSIVIIFAFLSSSLFYAIQPMIILKMLVALLCSVPLLTSISVFGALLTANIKKSSVIAVLLIFPLLISALILLSLAAGTILDTDSLKQAIAYIEINLGLTIILLPILCLLVKYLR